jgi:hypothetical protein
MQRELGLSNIISIQRKIDTNKIFKIKYKGIERS